MARIRVGRRPLKVYLFILELYDPLKNNHTIVTLVGEMVNIKLNRKNFTCAHKTKAFTGKWQPRYVMMSLTGMIAEEDGGGAVWRS